MMIKPEDAERYFLFLDGLRECQTAITPTLVMKRFGIDRNAARHVVAEWTRTYGEVREKSSQFLAALRETVPPHDKRTGQTEAEYWRSWCASKMTTGLSPLGNALCRIMLTDAAVEIVGCETARRWIFRDGSSLSATKATVSVR